MTIVLEKYTDKQSGLNASISLEKDSRLYYLTVTKPYTNNPYISHLLFKYGYMTKANAKRALDRFGEFEKGEN